MKIFSRWYRRHAGGLIDHARRIQREATQQQTKATESQAEATKRLAEARERVTQARAGWPEIRKNQRQGNDILRENSLSRRFLNDLHRGTST